MGWYVAISLLSDIRVRFLVGFVLAAIIVAIILIFVEMNIREKAKKVIQRLEQTNEDKIKIFVTSDKNPQDKLEFLDKFAKQYFYDLYQIPVTSSYSFIVNELKGKGSDDEIEFCKEMFACFYSNIKIDKKVINSLARVLIAMENSRPEDKKSTISNKDVVKQIRVKQEKHEKKIAESSPMVLKKEGVPGVTKSKKFFLFRKKPKVSAVNKRNLKDGELIKDFYEMQGKEEIEDNSNLKPVPSKKEIEIKQSLSDNKYNSEKLEENPTVVKKESVKVSKKESNSKKLEDKNNRRESRRRKRQLRRESKKKAKMKKLEKNKLKKIKSYSSFDTSKNKLKKTDLSEAPIKKIVSGEEFVRESSEGLAERIVRKKREQLEKGLTEFNFG